MKILQVAPMFLPILQDRQRYGGSERVIAALDREFVKLGHQSYVVAPGNSTVDGTLLSSPKTSIWKGSQGTSIDSHDEEYQQHFQRVLSFIDEVNPDVVHDQTGYLLSSSAYQKVRDSFSHPVLTTLHGPVDKIRQSRIHEAYRNRNEREFFNAISRVQETFFSQIVKVDRVIHNGVDVESYPFVATKEDYLFSIGRLTASKGQGDAISVAKKLGEKLVIAGCIVPQDRTYFDEVIKPHIDGEQIRFVGELDEVEKRPYFAKARALLNPISWEEPFGLVMIEALACGTPVVTYRRGAAPEIVEDGVTGFVVDSLEDMVAKTRELNQIDPRACREAVERKFCTKNQARDYLGLYGKMLKESTLSMKGVTKYQ